MIIDLHGEGGGLQTMALAQTKEDSVEPFGGKSVLSLGNYIKTSANIFQYLEEILIGKGTTRFDLIFLFISSSRYGHIICGP